MTIKSKTFSHASAGKLLSYLLAGFFISASPLANAQDGTALFKQKCSACHKVGGGRFVGPDLKNVTTKRSEDWLHKWIKSSTALIASGDKDANAIYNEFSKMAMPDNADLSDADITAICNYITAQSGGAVASATGDAAKPEAPAAPDASLTASAVQVEEGKNLFIGSSPLANGGAACVSCHNVNYNGVLPGGLLAKDLTTAHSRLGGDAGMQTILNAPPFPAMTQAYNGKPITEKEIAAISAFLYKVDKDTANQVAGSNPLIYGFAAAAGFLVLIFAVYFVRKKETVKKDIFDRQIKSV